MAEVVITKLPKEYALKKMGPELDKLIPELKKTGKGSLPLPAGINPTHCKEYIESKQPGYEVIVKQNKKNTIYVNGEFKGYYTEFELKKVPVKPASAKPPAAKPPKVAEAMSYDDYVKELQKSKAKGAANPDLASNAGLVLEVIEGKDKKAQSVILNKFKEYDKESKKWYEDAVFLARVYVDLMELK